MTIYGAVTGVNDFLKKFLITQSFKSLWRLEVISTRQKVKGTSVVCHRITSILTFLRKHPLPLLSAGLWEVSLPSS